MRQTIYFRKLLISEVNGWSKGVTEDLLKEIVDFLSKLLLGGCFYVYGHSLSGGCDRPRQAGDPVT